MSIWPTRKFRKEFLVIIVFASLASTSAFSQEKPKKGEFLILAVPAGMLPERMLSTKHFTAEGGLNGLVSVRGKSSHLDKFPQRVAGRILGADSSTIQDLDVRIYMMWFDGKGTLHEFVIGHAPGPMRGRVRIADQEWPMTIEEIEELLSWLPAQFSTQYKLLLDIRKRHNTKTSDNKD